MGAHHDRRLEADRTPMQRLSLLSPPLKIHEISVRTIYHCHVTMRMIKPVVVLSPGPSLIQATRPPPTLNGPPVKFNLEKNHDLD